MSARGSFPLDRPRSYPTRCHVCGNAEVVEKLVTLALPEPDGVTRLVQGVPAGVCTQCGEQYLRADVADAIDKILASPPARHEEVPVWDFASTA